jgi:hypothetical protein
MVRGLRTSANSSTLDDRRPADRSTSYHIPAATANLFRGPCPKSQPGQIQPSHRRDDSVPRGLPHEFLCDSWHCDRGTIWSKPTTMTTGRFWPRGAFFFRNANHRSKGKRPAHWKSSATKVCDSRQMRAEPTIPGTRPFDQRGVQQYRGVSTNDRDDRAAPEGWTT